ncbi:protein disulfide-isomerase 5-3 [Phtheirospermum japonicum]|uniref:Protein disulfide-isomerase 5-3 n=1 Tax=Phtheirospermum japonicum TaxID=374723 RepID=A0A830C0U6_9LAMI|nr:protein disulfide-isomerase 5-3 [Phtheirospermum japonicum]
MVSTSKIKSVDFYRKIPRDLTEASLSGAGLSIIAAFSMIFLFGMELNDYLTVNTSTSVVVDKSADGDFLRIDFDMRPVGTHYTVMFHNCRWIVEHDDTGFPALSCEFASIDVSDVLGTNRLNITKTVRKYSIDPNLNPTGSEFRSGPHAKPIKHDDENDEEYGEGSVVLTGNNFDRISHQDDHGHHDHESYYGDRDTDSLVKTMEDLVAPISLQSHGDSGSPSGEKKEDNKRPAPKSGGCRVEGFVRVKKVPGNLIVSARSASHSFDASQMNMSHVISHFSFGKKISTREMSDVKRVLPYLGRSHDRLTGLSYISNPSDSNANVTIEHYLQVVKTEVMTRSHKLVEEYEYTAHSSLAHSIHIPVAKFHFELSPMQVLITENSKSFWHFITSVCAIIGGVFTVAGIVDSILHNTVRFMKKVELGKNF